MGAGSGRACNRSGTMQIGMMGLGRMGANMVRRLLRAGHQCVVYDIDPGQRRGSRQGRRHRRRLGRGVRRQARKAAQRLADAAGGDHRARRRPGGGPDGRGRHRHRRRQLALSGGGRPGGAARRQGRPLRRCRHQRRRLGPRTRLLPDDRRAAGGDCPSRRRLRHSGAGRVAGRDAPTRPPAPPRSAICTAARAAPATSSRWSTTASNTASWPPMPRA